MNKQLLENWVEPKKKRVSKRTQQVYAQLYSVLHSQITRELQDYQNTTAEENIKRIELERSINHKIRRFHEYAIKENKQFPVVMYKEVNQLEKSSKNGTFEHVFPMSIACKLLLDGIFTIDQVFTIPICYLSQESDQKLRDAGYTKTTPDKTHFWKRYTDCFDVDGEIFDLQGNPVDTTETIWDHFEKYTDFLAYCKQKG